MVMDCMIKKRGFIIGFNTFLVNGQTGSGVHPTSYTIGYRELIPGGKAAGA
jgi:hypothetical protein